MERAIDSEAAYRFLSEQLVKETGAFSKGVNKGLNIARSAMRNPDAIPTLTPPNEWVSVEERLPEDDTSEYKAQIAVLVLTDRESIKIKKRTYHPGRVYYGKFYPERWDWGTFNDDRITHWMPLPERPKEDE